MAGKADLNPFVQLVEASCYCRPGRGGSELVGPITLGIEKGEFISILGPDGCGKEAVLRMVAGLLQPVSGEVRIAGRKIEGPFDDLGFVFKNPSLMPWRTVLGNILVQAELRGLDRGGCLLRARRLLEAMGISCCEESYPADLSDDEAYRAALCQAMVHHPALLLMDDWFIALDPLRREQMSLDLQRLLTGSGLTILFATTSIHEAVQLSDRIAIMSWGGKLVQIRSVDLPRPRRMDKLTTPQIAEHCSDIRMVFHAEGIFS